MTRGTTTESIAAPWQDGREVLPLQRGRTTKAAPTMVTMGRSNGRLI
jgi:hypothetical protein